MRDEGFLARRRVYSARIFASFLVAFSLTAPLGCADHYVSPKGSTDGTGTRSSPWDLQTALSQPDAVRPGDTIWLLGGTYKGTFHSLLSATEQAPIVVREYPGQHAIIDGSIYPAAEFFKTALRIEGCCTWYWGFEITNSDPRRIAGSPGSNPPDAKGFSLTVEGPHIKLINLVIHDTGAGPGVWSEGESAEIYGNIIYYNGWQDAAGRPDGHALYVNNSVGLDIIDNIMFDSFGYGVHAYGSTVSALDNHRLEGNIAFDNGALASAGFQRNLLIGNPCGGRLAHNPTVIENYTYYPLDATTGDNNLGLCAGCTGAVVKNNFFVGGIDSLSLVNCEPVSMTGNTFVGTVKGFSMASYPENRYFGARPSGTSAFVRKNRYDPGRAHIVVYNWEYRDSVAVDVSTVLSRGDEYRIQDVQDYYGTPVATGIYDGAPIVIGMMRATVSTPVGNINVTHTPPNFGAFVLLWDSSRPTRRFVPTLDRQSRETSRPVGRDRR